MTLPATSSRMGRVFIAAMLILTCLRVWIGPIDWEPAAQAQLPDRAAQRQELIEEARRTNAMLAEILRLLQTQTIKVTLEGSDKSKTPAAVRPPGAKDPKPHGASPKR